MSDWTSKDPDEIDRFSVDWQDLLGGDAIEASVWAFPERAGLVESEPEFDSRFSSIIIAGGTDGAIAVIENRVTTADGRTLEVTKRLPIVSTLAVSGTGYTVPTPAQMAVTMPAFAGVNIAALTDAIAEGAAKVNDGWKEADYRKGIMLYAAHTLTMDGHGSGTEATLQREGLGDFQRIESGGLKVSRFERYTGNPSGLEETSYGKRFKQLQRLNFAGPRAVLGLYSRPCSPLATDCD